MTFYDEWNEAITSKCDDISFIQLFLNKSKSSLETLLVGSSDDLYNACSFLYNYDLDMIIEKMPDEKNSIVPNMVVQFSSFESGIIDVPRVLSINSKSMIFEEIGENILGKRNELALKKYGENHAKLAELFSLVTLSTKRPTNVSITSFGEFSLPMDEKYKTKILRVLALRDPLVRNIINGAKKDVVYYSEETACLSDSTKIRRKPNVKYICELVLRDSKFNYLLNNIIW